MDDFDKRCNSLEEKEKGSYSCEFCGKTFPNPSKLYKHLKKEHIKHNEYKYVDFLKTKKGSTNELCNN